MFKLSYLIAYGRYTFLVLTSKNRVANAGRTRDKQLIDLEKARHTIEMQIVRRRLVLFP